MTRTRSAARLAALAAIAIVGTAQAAAAPIDAQTDAQTDARTDARTDAQTNALLDAIETTDDHLDTLSAAMQTTREYAVQGDTEVRRGRLDYERVRTTDATDADPDTGTDAASGAVPVRRFAATFEQTLVGRRLTEGERRFIFDGSWVVEIVPDEKQFTSRQVVPPGETFDPLRIGEGPFPAPIGQRKADILERFDAATPPLTEGLPADFHGFAEGKGLRQLRLTPKEGTRAYDAYDTIRLWYRPFETASGGRAFVPQIIRVIEPIGDESLVILTDVKVNEPIDPAVFDTTPPARGAGWNVRVAPYREETP